MDKISYTNVKLIINLMIPFNLSETILRNLPKPKILKCTDSIENFCNCFPFHFPVCHFLVAQVALVTFLETFFFFHLALYRL